VCRYNWHVQLAGSPGWPFIMLKCEYLFQIKYTGALSSNSTRKLLRRKKPKTPINVKNIKSGKTFIFIMYITADNEVSPRGRRDDMPPPMAVRLAADLRPSADGSAVRTSLVAGGGYSLGSCARRTKKTVCLSHAGRSCPRPRTRKSNVFSSWL